MFTFTGLPALKKVWQIYKDLSKPPITACYLSLILKPFLHFEKLGLAQLTLQQFYFILQHQTSHPHTLLLHKTHTHIPSYMLLKVV